MRLRDLTDELEDLAVLDGLSGRLAGAVNSAVAPVKSLLSGTWLDHPLHPALTNLPLGCWSGAVVLDLFGGAAGDAAVQPMVALGTLTALPTVVAGLSDWADSYGPERRVGLVHAAVNLTGLSLFTASLAARRRARWLRLLGLAAVGTGGYLGGHLTYARGLGSTTRSWWRGPPSGPTRSMRTACRRRPPPSPRPGERGCCSTAAARRSTHSPTSALTPADHCTRAPSTTTSA